MVEAVVKQPVSIFEPVVGLTAHAMEDDRQRFLNSGMNDVLTKPFTIDSLRDAVLRFPPGAESG